MAIKCLRKRLSGAGICSQTVCMILIYSISAVLSSSIGALLTSGVRR